VLRSLFNELPDFGIELVSLCDPFFRLLIQLVSEMPMLLRLVVADLSFLFKLLQEFSHSFTLN
jgi:hypothetical protein